jgi:hypothetical protein
MAKMTVKPVEPTPPPKMYILELDQDELDALHTLCINVGGHPATTWRGYISQINNAITEHAVPRFLSEGSVYAVNK